jgi:GWxTD domain-containing protein
MRTTCFLGFFVIMILFSCTVKQKAAVQKNQSSLYNPGSSYLHPEFLVYHQSDSISQLIVNINNDELLFNQANPEHVLQAKIKIQYQLVDISTGADSKIIADSASISKKLEKVADRKATLITFFIKAKYDKSYTLKFTLIDSLRNVKQLSYISVNKLNKFSGQNFKVISRMNELPLFRNFVVPGEAVSFQIAQTGVKKFYIKYRPDDTSLPPPPFSVQPEPKFIFHADSIWPLNFSSQRSFMFLYDGMYLIQTDSTRSDGLLLTNPGKSFPKVTESAMMIPPIEYLTTTDEFSKIKKGENKKLSVDNFWLKIGGNIEMARELIRIYYKRMYYANLFFTSYKPGWKTDRGMIYMIFGPPSYMTKDAISESWQYYVKQDASNLTIKFDKIASPYSENHYVMERNDSYTRFWRTAIDSWRKGKAYSLEE